MSKDTKFIWGLLILFCIAGVMAIFFYLEYVKAYNRAEDNAAIIRQNEEAFAAEKSQKDSAIQDLAAKVTNLNTQKEGEKRRADRYRALASDLQVKLDRITASGTGVASTGEDSIGKYSRVDFTGSKGIVTFSGYTKYYTPSLSFWDIDLGFDPIPVHSGLYREESTGLWKIRTETSVPGVMLRATHSIDSAIFISLRNDKQPGVSSLPSFGLRLKGNIATVASDLQQKNIKGVGLDVSAEAYYRYYNITYYPLTGVLSGGIIVDFDVGKFLSNLFW